MYVLNILFMGYSRGTLNYPKLIAPSNPTHIMSMANLIVIGVKTLRIDKWVLFRERVH